MILKESELNVFYAADSRRMRGLYEDTNIGSEGRGWLQFIFSKHALIYGIQYTIYNIQYTIYSIQNTIYNIQYTI